MIIIKKQFFLLLTFHYKSLPFLRYIVFLSKYVSVELLLYLISLLMNEVFIIITRGYKSKFTVTEWNIHNCYWIGNVSIFHNTTIYNFIIALKIFCHSTANK